MIFETAKTIVKNTDFVAAVFWINKATKEKFQVKNTGKGHYYENHNIENQKEHRKICEPSLHRKSPLKWSLHQKSLRQKVRLG